MHSQPVGNAESNENPQVSPLLARFNAQRSQILRSTGIWAVAAVLGVVRIDEISLSCLLHKIHRKLVASLARRGIKVGGFVAGTLDGLVGQSGGKDTTDPVCTRIQIVQLEELLDIKIYEGR